MFKRVLVIFVALFLCAGLTWADDVQIDVNARVPTTTAFTMVIHPVDDGAEDWGTEVTEMTFGTLTDTLADGNPAGSWYSRKAFVVLFYMASSSQYTIVQTGSLLTGDDTGSTLPQGSFGFTPVYVSSDPGNTTSARGTLGNPDYAYGSNKPIYTSDASGTGETIRAYYSIPPDTGTDPWTGWTSVPLSQDADLYRGTVTFTLTWS